MVPPGEVIDCLVEGLPGAVEPVRWIAVRGPLARIPEKTLKLAVGVLLLTSFGTFWGAEGAGAHWPGGDAALLGVIAVVAITALVFVALLRRAHDRRVPGSPPVTEPVEAV